MNRQPQTETATQTANANNKDTKKKEHIWSIDKTKNIKI